MSLTASDKLFWAPNALVLDWLVDLIPSNARVLEIGPGDNPFPRANVFVDFTARDNQEILLCNVLTSDLPFADKEFDFVYCRHVLEDLWNPFRVVEEMSRIASAGYIETPSPVAELCRGVMSESFIGYPHHFNCIWVDEGKLKFLHKFPAVEQINLTNIEPLLRAGSLYWNSYYLWHDHIEWRHLQPPVDFEIMADYPRLLEQAVHQSLSSSNLFYENIIKDAPKVERKIA